MIAIVGLGNPGKSYEKTILNLGYMAIDKFALSKNMKFTKSKYYGKVAEGNINGEKIILLKPETFMNLSGKSVEDLVRSLKLDLSNLLVIVDDIDLEFGKIRVRAKGSAGTHNGLRDIVQKLGENFARLRIGAGKPEGIDLATYVLSNISADKLKDLDSVFQKTNRIIDYFVLNKNIEGLDINKI